MPQVSKSKPIDFTNPVDGGMLPNAIWRKAASDQEGKTDLIELLVPLLQDKQERGEHHDDEDCLEPRGERQGAPAVLDRQLPRMHQPGQSGDDAAILRSGFDLRVLGNNGRGGGFDWLLGLGVHP